MAAYEPEKLPFDLGKIPGQRFCNLSGENDAFGYKISRTVSSDERLLAANMRYEQCSSLKSPHININSI